jgi:hypothetical protein
MISGSDIGRRRSPGIISPAAIIRPHSSSITLSPSST